MKSIHEQLINGNKSAAADALYNLPFEDYPQLILYCAENPEFGTWAAIQLGAILKDGAITLEPCGDRRQFKCTAEAVGALNRGQPAAAVLQLTYGAKKRTNRLIRRSVRLSGQMMMKHGLAGLDKTIEACNIGMEDD